MTGMTRERRWPFFLGLITVVFITGAASAMIVNRFKARQPDGPRVIANGVGDLLRTLKLTKLQRIKADSILSAQAPKSESIMVDAAMRLKAVSDSIDSELRLILTPEQRSQLDHLRERSPRFMLKRREANGQVDTVIIGDSFKR